MLEEFAQSFMEYDNKSTEWDYIEVDDIEDFAAYSKDRPNLTLVKFEDRWIAFTPKTSH